MRDCRRSARDFHRHHHHHLDHADHHRHPVFNIRSWSSFRILSTLRQDGECGIVGGVRGMRGVRRVVVRVARWRRVAGPSLPGDDHDVDCWSCWWWSFRWRSCWWWRSCWIWRSNSQPAVSWGQWSCVVPFVHWCCYVPDETVWILSNLFWGPRNVNIVVDIWWRIIFISFLSPSGSSYGRGRIIRGDLIARIPDIWYMVYDIWYMVDDIWYKLHHQHQLHCMAIFRISQPQGYHYHGQRVDHLNDHQTWWSL